MSKRVLDSLKPLVRVTEIGPGLMVAICDLRRVAETVIDARARVTGWVLDGGNLSSRIRGEHHGPPHRVASRRQVAGGVEDKVDGAAAGVGDRLDRAARPVRVGRRALARQLLAYGGTGSILRPHAHPASVRPPDPA